MSSYYQRQYFFAYRLLGMVRGDKKTNFSKKSGFLVLFEN